MTPKDKNFLKIQPIGELGSEGWGGGGWVGGVEGF